MRTKRLDRSELFVTVQKFYEDAGDAENVVGMFQALGDPAYLLAQVEAAASDVLKAEQVSEWYPPLADGASQIAQLARSAMFAVQGARHALAQGDAGSALVEGMKAGRLMVALAVAPMEKAVKAGRGSLRGGKKGGDARATTEATRKALRNAEIAAAMNRLVESGTKANSAAISLLKQNGRSWRLKSVRAVINVWNRSRQTSTR